MFLEKNNGGYREVLPGIKMKTTVFGEKTLMTEFLLTKGSELSKHSHVHEQTGYLVSGQIILSIGDEIFEAKPGDSWCIPSNVSHGAEIIKDSIALEVFAPVREDYLPQNSDS